ncbi:MAG: S8 family serine peptidase, partial [Phycisphaerales bacterium]|nr:S8 family serine peptidase [Phycisphaerales bacterium]
GWDFSIMPVRYYNSPGGGFLSDLLDGARWAADHGARCVNVSQTGVENAPVQVTGAYVRSRGALLIWAAGNDGRDLSWFDWEDVIIVGATDQNDEKPSWSAHGLAVDVFAPGNEILSTGVVSVLAQGSGTSASTPLVSGLAGLIWSAHPNLLPVQVEQMIFRNAVDLGDPGEDDAWGHGRIDAASAVACPVDLVVPWGTLDFFDIVAFLNWFEAANPIADWDSDGAFTIFDLIEYLGDFDRCF